MPDILLADPPAMKKTREGFGRALVDLGDADPNVVVLVGDLVESTMTSLLRRASSRSASSRSASPSRTWPASPPAWPPWARSRSSPPTARSPSCRAADQIRVSIAYSNLHVKIGGAHGGISVGPDGATHQAMEEIAIIRSIPNMSLVVPCDFHEARQGHGRRGRGARARSTSASAARTCRSSPTRRRRSRSARARSSARAATSPSSPAASWSTRR